MHAKVLCLSAYFSQLINDLTFQLFRLLCLATEAILIQNTAGGSIEMLQSVAHL